MEKRAIVVRLEMKRAWEWERRLDASDETIRLDVIPRDDIDSAHEWLRLVIVSEKLPARVECLLGNRPRQLMPGEAAPMLFEALGIRLP